MRKLYPNLPLVATAVAIAAFGCGDSGDSGPAPEPEDVGLSLPNCEPAEYGGEGVPEGLIVSDLPMQGDSAERSRQQVEAIRLIMEERDWSADGVEVAFQACDDSIKRTGLWDPKTCRRNATAYERDADVLGVIGTYNSGCAELEIPILGKSKVAMISPGNTAVCLTQRSPICERGLPDSLYRTGHRNYARVVPNDAFQGAALAEFADDIGVKRPYVVYAANDPTSTGQAQNFSAAAQHLGVTLAGIATWDPGDRDYGDLFARVNRSGADGVVLAGLTEQHGSRVIADKVRFVGPNRRVPLIAFDGFAQQSTIDEAGPASAGMYASVPGRVPGELPAQGAELVDQLTAGLDGAPVEQFAPYAGEAASVLLDAIAAGGTDRPMIVESLFASEADPDGIVGPYGFQTNGDPTVGPVTVLQADGSFEPVTTVSPSRASVVAARG